MADVTVTIQFNKFAQIAEYAAGPRRNRGQKASFDVEGQAKNRVPVDTKCAEEQHRHWVPRRRADRDHCAA